MKVVCLRYFIYPCYNGTSCFVSRRVPNIIILLTESKRHYEMNSFKCSMLISICVSCAADEKFMMKNKAAGGCWHHFGLKKIPV